MSFDIHPRSPSPEPTQDDGPEVNEDVNEVNELETKLSIKLERKKFGKAKIDTRFRDEQERQRYILYIIYIVYKYISLLAMWVL